MMTEPKSEAVKRFETAELRKTLKAILDLQLKILAVLQEISGTMHEALATAKEDE